MTLLPPESFADAVRQNYAPVREHLLRVFRDAAEKQTLSAHDILALRTALPKPLPEHLRNLAGKVLDGDRANAAYQGISGGNLRPGSPGEHLNWLVDKWFLGLDHPLAQDQFDGHNRLEYRHFDNPLFDNDRIEYQDVQQGAVGDCYFLASLAQVAMRKPELLRSMFIDNGDDTFTVRFFRDGVPEYVTVDRLLPVKDGQLYFGRSRVTSGLWMALAEKAYAQLNESGWIGHDGTNSYLGLAAGAKLELNTFLKLPIPVEGGGLPNKALAHLTGQRAELRVLPNVSFFDMVGCAISKVFEAINGVIDEIVYSLGHIPLWMPLLGQWLGLLRLYQWVRDELRKKFRLVFPFSTVSHMVNDFAAGRLVGVCSRVGCENYIGQHVMSLVGVEGDDLSIYDQGTGRSFTVSRTELANCFTSYSRM